MWLSYPKVSWHKVFCISTGSGEYLGANTTAKVHINFSTADNHVWNFCPHQRESFQRGNSNSVTLHVRWAVFLMPEWDSPRPSPEHLFPCLAQGTRQQHSMWKGKKVEVRLPWWRESSVGSDNRHRKRSTPMDLGERLGIAREAQLRNTA